MVSGHKRTNSIPSSVRRTSEAGHSGRDRVVRRSWTKLSNSGLKSSSTLPAQHLGGEGGRGREGGREGGRGRGRIVTTLYIIFRVTHFFMNVDRKVDPILSDSS